MISVWRHARPDQVIGRCIGRTDVTVDRRRSRRLAHRIRAQARREGAPRVIWTSPLRRCADVGRWLSRWGWTHHIDPRLLEVDFGPGTGVPGTTSDRRRSTPGAATLPITRPAAANRW
jgi:alpha-ribazole phosphatase